MHTHFDFLASAKRTLNIEQEALQFVCSQLDDEFIKACQIIQQTHQRQGRVIVTGMGKSGHIGNKIAATLASTGSPAFFLHPAEASHGDLGMVTANDCIIALSYSGSSAEILALIPLFKRLAVKLISLTGDLDSPLAQAADAQLNCAVPEEACPLDLAPTSSTTVSLAMGDALAIALLEANGFTAEDFAFSHPGGALGRKLLLKVSDLMHTGHKIPKISATAQLSAALLEVSSKGLGLTTVTDAHGGVCGIFTDGDLRRLLEQNIDIRTLTIGEVMQPTYQSINSNILAVEALNTMEKNKITALVVEDAEQLCGIIHLHALLEAGIA